MRILNVRNHFYNCLLMVEAQKLHITQCGKRSKVILLRLKFIIVIRNLYKSHPVAISREILIMTL